jgi:undecaprenyl diphosphate synthase
VIELKKTTLLEEISKKDLPQHIAFILDGNGRWATSKGLPRTIGHQKGAKTLKEITIECNNIGIKYITAFVFSTENWNRPIDEVNFIMNEIIKLCNDYKTLVKNNIKLNWIGSSKNVPLDVVNAIKEAVYNTKDCTGLNLNMAFNYGSKTEIVDSIKCIIEDNINPNDISEKLVEKYLYTKDIPNVDLLIRTSGEMRISNFLLWQIAYAEIYFTKTYWPDFHKKELYEAIFEYQKRNRRFGGLNTK